LLIGAGVVIAVIILDRILLAMESKGWIYWRRAKGRQGGGAMAGLAMQELLQPEAREAREWRLEEKTEQYESGDPPVPGSSNGD
jgi:hypothetical protein